MATRSFTGVITDLASTVFTNVGTSFLTAKIDGVSVQTILGEAVKFIPPSLSNFGFFYKEPNSGDVELDLTQLLSSALAKKYLLFIDLQEGDSISITTGVTWLNRLPIFEAGDQYLIYVYKVNGVVYADVLWCSNSKITAVDLEFLLEDTTTLDLTQAFPDYIESFKLAYSGTLDWGDGTTSSMSDGDYVHEYSSTGTYNVVVTGICQGLGHLPKTLSKVNQINGVVLFDKTFAYCTLLTEVPENLLRYATLQQDFPSLFQGSGITSIPENLFSYATQVRHLTATFAETQIGEIPAGLLKPLKYLTTLDATFDSCYELIGIPADLLSENSALTSVERMFQATGVITMPQEFFDDKLALKSFKGLLSVNDLTARIKAVMDAIRSIPEDFGTWPYMIRHEGEPYEYGVLSSTDSFKVMYNPSYLPIFAVGTSYIDFNHYLSPTSQSQYYSMNLSDEYSGGGGASLYYGDSSSGTVVSHGFRVSADDVKTFGVPLTLEYKAEEDDQAVRLDQLNETQNSLQVEIDEINALFQGDYDVVSPVISGTWTTVGDNDATTTSTSANVTVDRGYEVSWSGSYKWTSASGYKDPTSASGLTTELPASGVSSSTISKGPLTESNGNTTYTLTLSAPKVGLMVNGSHISLAEGDDTSSASIRVTWAYRYYAGISTNTSITDDEMMAFSMTGQITSLSATLNISPMVDGQYLFFCYPQALGTLSQVLMGEFNVLSAFQLMDSCTRVITRGGTQYSYPYYVYRSTSSGAYPDSSGTKLVFS